MRPVEAIPDMLGSEMTMKEILEDHPELKKEDILAVIYYGKLLASGHTINKKN